MKEEWKPVVGYEGLYEVSNLGNVRSKDRVLTYNRVLTYKGKNQAESFVTTRAFKGQMLKPNILKDGYAQVALQKP